MSAQVFYLFLPRERAPAALNGLMVTIDGEFRRLEVVRSREQAFASIASLDGRLTPVLQEQAREIVRASCLPDESDEPPVAFDGPLALVCSGAISQVLDDDGFMHMTVHLSPDGRYVKALLPRNAKIGGLFGLIDGGRPLVYVFFSKEEARRITRTHARMQGDEESKRQLSAIDGNPGLPETSDRQTVVVDGYAAGLLCKAFESQLYVHMNLN